MISVRRLVLVSACFLAGTFQVQVKIYAQSSHAAHPDSGPNAAFDPPPGYQPSGLPLNTVTRPDQFMPRPPPAPQPVKRTSSSPFDRVLSLFRRSDEGVHNAGVVQCNHCGLTQTAQSPYSNSQAMPVAPSPVFKSESELNQWMSCHQANGSFQDAYEREFKPAIAQAAVAFGVPRTLLTCLMYQESKFNASAMNQGYRDRKGRRHGGSGATGAAQFMPIEMRHLSGIISSAPPLHLTGPAAAAYTEAASSEYELGQSWQKYYQAIGQSPPRTFGRAQALNPISAVGGEAMYVRFVMNYFEEKLGSQATLDTDPKGTQRDFDLMVLVAGAYNKGHGGAMQALRGTTPAEWRESLAANNHETREHMKSIAACMQRGNMDAPGGNGRTCN